FDSGIFIGSSNNTPAVLSVSGGIGSNASLIVNQLNSGDLFTASSSGTTKFTIANNGNITATGTVTLSNLNHAGVVHTDVNGLLSSSAINLAGGGNEISGILPLANGGTNANLTANAGGIVYSNNSALAITAPGNTGQCLTSSETNT